MAGQVAALPGMEALVPPRSLDLPGHVWGIDPSTQKIALAILPMGAHPVPVVQKLKLEQDDGGAGRLAKLHAALGEWALPLATEYPPTLVLIEQPFGRGKRVHPQSYFIVGVALAALRTLLGEAGIIDTVDPMTWKRDALGEGKGAASPAVYTAWAQQVAGYEGKDEDEAAAVGVATCAGLRLARSS